jgi:hypothetical protein
MTENKKHCLAATTECGEWPGQALQDDTIPQGVGGGGGGWAGSVLMPIFSFWISLFSLDLFWE